MKPVNLRSGGGGGGGARGRSTGISGGGNKKAKVTTEPADVNTNTRYYFSMTHAYGKLYQHLILQCIAALTDFICGGFPQTDWRALPGKWKGIVPWNPYQGQCRAHMKAESTLREYGMAMEQLFGREGLPPLEFHGQIPKEMMIAFSATTGNGSATCSRRRAWTCTSPSRRTPPISRRARQSLRLERPPPRRPSL